MATEQDLRSAVARVVQNDNCSGCGGCTALSPSLMMELSDQGFLRPVWRDADDENTGRLGVDLPASSVVSEFANICPGVTSKPLQEPGQSRHPIFGNYLKVWQGWATDERVRYTGSSGGVLTAIAGWIADQEPDASVLGASSCSVQPSRTVAVKITSKADALAAAGSRYAPVAIGSAFDRAAPPSAIVSKPCEAVSLRALTETSIPAERPLILSFFCAGTPSQSSTDALLDQLGIPTADAKSVNYRGNGWPGRFRVEGPAGRQESLSYEESWGSHLGRNLQWRCKICPDGTGESADIAVGDYWEESGAGYPSFEDAPGRSVIIARSHRGLDILDKCVAAGIIELFPLQLEAAAAVQPLQVDRRKTLLGRLLGRRLGGKTVPKYIDYHLATHTVSEPLGVLRAAIGTYLRTTGIRTGRNS
jgi:coenzyme F420 hydrogenase subunit beta